MPSHCCLAHQFYHLPHTLPATTCLPLQFPTLSTFWVAFLAFLHSACSLPACLLFLPCTHTLRCLSCTTTPACTLPLLFLLHLPAHPPAAPRTTCIVRYHRATAAPLPLRILRPFFFGTTCLPRRWGFRITPLRAAAGTWMLLRSHTVLRHWRCYTCRLPYTHTHTPPLPHASPLPRILPAYARYLRYHPALSGWLPTERCCSTAASPARPRLTCLHCRRYAAHRTPCHFRDASPQIPLHILARLPWSLDAFCKRRLVTRRAFSRHCRYTRAFSRTALGILCWIRSICRRHRAHCCALPMPPPHNPHHHEHPPPSPPLPPHTYSHTYNAYLPPRPTHTTPTPH